MDYNVNPEKEFHMRHLTENIDVERCDHYELCDAHGAGCSRSLMKTCPIKMDVIDLGSKWPCPAVNHGHCEIPHYAVMANAGLPCGELGKCFIGEAFKGLIPPQDNISNGHVPESYCKKRSKRENLITILKGIGLR